MRGFLPPNTYAQWSALWERPAALAETSERPPEATLQIAWAGQRLRPEALRATDGRRVRVLHPGLWNRGEGPDFRGAALRFDADPPVVGDVEIDVEPAGWNRHGHALNPAYREVKLQVVWRARPGLRTLIPVLPIADALDASIEEIAREPATEPGLFPSQSGRCAPILSQAEESFWKALLLQAAEARLRQKARRFADRARQTGWDAALWEGLFEALGYRRNAWPMRALGEAARELVEDRPSLTRLQARLLGLAGLLPRDLPLRQTEESLFARALWDSWWREQSRWAGRALPEAIWSFRGLRPANHPHRRLALAAHWLRRPELPRRIERWLAEDIPGPKLRASLAELLQAEEDPFWERRFHLFSPAQPAPRPLLGRQRLDELAVNVVLPWLWARADEGGRKSLRRRALERSRRWPAAGANSQLRLGRLRLAKGRALPRPGRAAYEQGLLQILRDFCGRAGARCEGCRLPELLQRDLGRAPR